MKPLPTHDLDEIATRCADVFRALDGAHVLITGASGFVGSWLFESIQHVCAMTPRRLRWTAGVRRGVNLSHSSDRGGIVIGDIRQLVIPDGVTHVIHCASAASAAENAEAPGDVCGMIRMGTDRVAQECRRVGVSRLLVLSSGSVYEPKSDGAPYREDDPLRRVGASDRIARAKVDAEAYALDVRSVPTVIARGFAMLGPRLPPQFAAAQFMADALAGRPIRVTNPGTVRSYLYASDMAAWLWTLLVKGEAGTAYNVGGDWRDRHAMLGIADAISDRTGAIVHEGEGFATAPFCPYVDRAGALGLVGWTTTTEAIARWWAWERGT